MIAESAKKFIGLSSFETLAMFRRGLFYAYLTIYLRHYLGLSVTATTLFATLPMLVNITSQAFIWGRVSDHFQLRRSLIAAGELMAALGTVGVWYLHRIPDNHRLSGYIIILGLSVVELFWSMSNISWTALISDLYEQEQRGRIQGRLTSMGGIGRIAGIWVGGWLYEGLDSQWAGWGFYHGDLFFIAAAVMVISTLPLLMLPEGGALPLTGSSELRNPGLSPESTEAFRIFVVFLVSMTLINFGRNSIAIVFPQYLTSGTGLALDSRTLSYVLNTQSMAVVCLGWWVGFFCHRWGTPATLLTASASSMLALVILAGCTSLPMIYTGSFLRGVADACIMASAYEMASVLIPANRRARRFAWFNATFFLSWGLPGTIVVGPLVDLLVGTGYAESYAYRVSFGLAACVVFAGWLALCILFYVLRRKRQILINEHALMGPHRLHSSSIPNGR